MLFMVIERVHGSDKSRHVATRLLRQMEINIPIILFTSRPSYGLVHVTRSAVVSRDHQNPVFVNLIQIFQETNGCLRGFYRITAFVNKRIYFQLVHLPCSVHKLPQATSPRTGKCPWVQSTLNHGQVFQLLRQSLPIQHFFKNREIIGTQPQHRSHLGSTSHGI